MLTSWDENDVGTIHFLQVLMLSIVSLNLLALRVQFTACHKHQNLIRFKEIIS